MELHTHPISNLTINILLKVIQHLASSAGFLPKILYIQLDNCYRENNRFFFAFCALLVQLMSLSSEHTLVGESV